MSIASTAPNPFPPPSLPSSTPSSGPGAAATRGTTQVTDHAARRLAMAAAREVGGVVGAAAGGLSGLLPSSLSSDDAEVNVRAAVHDEKVALDVTIGLEYPRPVRATLEELARHLDRRMREYGGLRIERLDITVAELRPPAKQPRRRVQ